MGLRDRLRGILGRERPAGAPASERAVPSAGGHARPAGDAPDADRAAPHLVALPSRGPTRVTEIGDALVLDVRAPRVDGPDDLPAVPGARAVAFDSLGEAAKSMAGRPVVVVDADEERAAAAAERLHALGVNASWLAGGLPAARAGAPAAPFPSTGPTESR